MKNTESFYQKLILTLGTSLLALGITSRGVADSDILYIGDAHDSADSALHSTVKRFGANTGRYLGVFIQPTVQSIPNHSSTFLDAPRGLILNCQGRLLVANANDHQRYAGEVFEYRNGGQIGIFFKALVAHVIPGSSTDAPNIDAPFVPRGMVLGQYLFVASQGSEDSLNNGLVRAYNPQSGELAYALSIPQEFASGNFHPDGMVINKDILYVANRRPPGVNDGEILRYNLRSKAWLEPFVRSNATNGLVAPEGIVFGPDGNLYVISYRGISPTDDILIFAGPHKPNPGAFLDRIALDKVSSNPQDRAAGSALLFGPDGFLYVPITGPGSVNGQPAGYSTGEVRRYNVHNKKYKVLVPAFLSGGPMEQPWYLTFGKTDPATLAYPAQ